MRIFLRFSQLATCLVLLPLTPATADLGVLVEYIELDERSATALVREHAGKPSATGLRDALQKRVEEEKAKIISTSFVRSIDRQRVKSESIHELIYPTEFDPPETPQTVTGPIPEGLDLKTPASPTAFEMRPVGDSVEVEVAGSDEGIAEANVALERVQFVDFLQYGKEEAATTMPLFYTTKITTAVAVRMGDYALIGVQTPRKREGAEMVGDPERRVLVFVRVDRIEESWDDKAKGDKS